MIKLLAIILSLSLVIGNTIQEDQTNKEILEGVKSIEIEQTIQDNVNENNVDQKEDFKVIEDIGETQQIDATSQETQDNEEPTYPANDVLEIQSENDTLVINKEELEQDLLVDAQGVQTEEDDTPQNTEDPELCTLETKDKCQEQESQNQQNDDQIDNFEQQNQQEEQNNQSQTIEVSEIEVDNQEVDDKLNNHQANNNEQNNQEQTDNEQIEENVNQNQENILEQQEIITEEQVSSTSTEENSIVIEHILINQQNDIEEQYAQEKVTQEQIQEEVEIHIENQQQQSNVELQQEEQISEQISQETNEQQDHEEKVDNHDHQNHHDHNHNHNHNHNHDHNHHHHTQEQSNYQSQQQSYQSYQNQSQNSNQDLWKQELQFVPDYCLLVKQIQQFQKDLPNLLRANLPQNKEGQVLFSVILVSLPSIPIFLLLLFTVGIRNRGTTIQYMIAFSFGTMLGDVFFHMLPQILEQNNDHHHSHSHDHSHDSHENQTFCLVLGGVLLFAFIDLFIIKLKNFRGKREEHEHDHNNSALIFLLGDFLHNFTDGIALGATFTLNIVSGITTTIAILMHEIPHEIGDFAYLLKQGKCVFVILFTQVVTSTGCFLGGYVGLQYAEKYEKELIGITCGSFLYVALVNILPELKQSFAYRPKFGRLIMNLISIAAGLFAMKFIGQLE